MTELRTARAWGVAPSAFRAWPRQDQKLALALTLYEGSLCPGCGQQTHLSWNPVTEDHWVVDEHGCFACKARDRAAKATQERVSEEVGTSHIRHSVQPQEGLVKWGVPEHQQNR